MTAHPNQATVRLERIKEWATSGEGSLRTHLDEWAAYEVGGGLLTRGMNQRWFNNPCAKSEGRRLLEHMDCFSPAARAICERGASGDPAVKKPRKGEPAPFRLMVDHSIPVAVLGQEIKRSAELQTIAGLREFLILNFRRAVITFLEDDLLNRPYGQQGRSLRQRMPDGWSFGDDPYARYRAAGIKIEVMQKAA
jgi:hypothetical protein